MRKNFLLSILIIMSYSSFAQQYSEPFDFYIYSFEEAGGLFNIFQYFDQMESGDLKDEMAYEYFLNQGLTTNSVAGLFTEAFFREMENPDVRAYTLDFFHILRNRSVFLVFGIRDMSQKLLKL